MITKTGQKLAAITFMDANAIAESVVNALKIEEQERAIYKKQSKTPNLKNNTSFQSQFESHVPKDVMRTYISTQAKQSKP